MTKQEKLIQEVIARYGETINLKKTPYVLIEIIGRYGGAGFGGVRAGCAPPGGTGGRIRADCAPPGGPPDIYDEAILIAEIARISSELSRISTALKRAPKKRKAKK
ncbi:MAG: hypothetical protein WAN69_18645 [Candidatus Korobacteraceae bacterium]|jgi:hypothetical protein